MVDKVRENRLRRMAERRGLVLIKSRRRDPLAVDFGRFALADKSTNAPTFGFGVHGLPSAGLDEIETFLTNG